MSVIDLILEDSEIGTTRKEAIRRLVDDLHAHRCDKYAFMKALVLLVGRTKLRAYVELAKYARDCASRQ